MKEQKNNYYSLLTGYRRAMPIALIALSIFSAICVFSSGTGLLGASIGRFLRGLLSWGGYVMPFVLAVHAICYAEDVARKKLRSRFIFSAIAVFTASIVEYAIVFWNVEAVFAPGEFYSTESAGGFIGSFFGFVLSKIFGHIGILILAAAALGIYATFFFADKTGRFGEKAIAIGESIFGTLANVEGHIKKGVAEKKEAKALQEEEAHILRSDELIADEFFTNEGVEGLSIRDNKAVTEPTVEMEEAFNKSVNEVQPPHRRRSASKPLDLTYGLEESEEVHNTEGQAASQPDKQETLSFLGLDDSAENVFTNRFDPFNFATDEKLATKPSSKAEIKEEELDEMTKLELRGEPTEREKRMMELERKKKLWLERKKAEAGTPSDKAKEEDTPTVNSEFNSAVAEETDMEEEKASEPSKHSASTPATEASPSVNAYTSYSSTQTTYTQPIKTVEFTISSDPAVPSVPPHSTAEQPASIPADERIDKTTEDVAAVIAERIARNNPAYARSANEMITYTKVTPSPEEIARREITPMDTLADAVGEMNAVDGISADPFPAAFGSSQIMEFGEKQESDEVVFTESIAEPVIEDPDTAKTAYQRAASFAVRANEVVFEPEITSNDQKYENAPAPEDNQASNADATPSEEIYPQSSNTVAPLTNSADTVTEYNPEYQPIEDTSTTVAAEIFTDAEDASEVPQTEPHPELMMSFDEDSESKDFDDTATPSIADGIDWNASSDESDASTSEQSEDDSVIFSDEPDEEIPEDEEDPISEIPEEETVPQEEIPPAEQNPDVIKMREMFPFLTPIGEQPTAKAPVEETHIEEAPTEPEEDDTPPFDIPAATTPAPAALVSMDEIKAEEKKAKKPDYSNYEFPSIDLLAKEEASSDENIQAEIQENADKLIETLASFGVSASIKGVDRGPRITRYEVVPAKGVKVSAILNLQDDIALNLAAGSIRMEAPIPGKSAVGIEIPNKKSSIVRLRDLLETEDFQGSKSKTAVCIGRDVAGQPVFGDIAKMPHLLIAGATGMGKSVCINSLMISMLYKARPDEVKFIMIDPKQVEFTMYNGIPHLLVPVVSDAKQAAGALMWAVEEMERRYNLLNPLCVRNVEAYNEKVMADPSLGEPMSRIVIVIDEFADLMLQVKDPVETLVMRIAQKARAAGIYLIIGTQRPSVNVITGVIKANVPSRISCKVMSNVDSKTVLDSAGAEKLLDRGDALYAPAGSPKPHRVQCAFVADSEVEAIMAHLKKFSDGSSYDSSVMEEIERAAQKCSKKGGGSSDAEDGDDEIHGEGYLNDRQFLDAVEVAVNTRKISTSLIQRKLSIGYGKAAKFIDIMEDMGIVGEANGQRPREVLITPDEWREKLARATLD